MHANLGIAVYAELGDELVDASKHSNAVARIEEPANNHVPQPLHAQRCPLGVRLKDDLTCIAALRLW